ANCHAKMAVLEKHADTFGSDLFLDVQCDLACHALLNLQAAGKHIDHARNFAETQNTFVRQISNMGLAEERQQVVFAEAEKLDILYDDHLVVGHANRRAVQYMIKVQVVTAGQLLESIIE